MLFEFFSKNDSTVALERYTRPEPKRFNNLLVNEDAIVDRKMLCEVKLIPCRLREKYHD